MSRLGKLAGLSVWVAAAGCAVGPAPDTESQRHRRAGEGRCGELLLVEAAWPNDRTVQSSAATAALASRYRAGVDPTAELAARRFTVAIRAKRDAHSPEASTDLFTSTEPRGPLNGILIEGTGTVVDCRGLILTNHHVVQHARLLEVWVRGGWVPARIVGIDRQSDLAAISVDQTLPAAARWTNAADLRVGQAVAALGFAPGQDPADGPNTLRGRLTGLHRSLQSALDPTQDRYYGDLLESTIPLESGHSGGPLIDRAGAVVGINTASVTHRKSGRRTGYAIPASDHMRSVVAALARGGDVSHGYLGVLVCATPRGNTGVPIERVVPGGPADQAGVRTADVILRVAGTAVNSAAQLAEAVRGGAAGSPVRLDLRRGRRDLELTCTLAWRPSFR